MNALTIGLALLVAACGALDDYRPQIDRAAIEAANAGYCLKIVCRYPPVACGPSAGVCK